MENQNEIMEVVEQGGSKKGMLKKVAVVAAGIAAGVGAVMFFRKKRAEKQLSEEDFEVSEDSTESTEE